MLNNKETNMIMSSYMKIGLMVYSVSLITAQLQDAANVDQMTIKDLLTIISSRQQQQNISDQMTIGELLSTIQSQQNTNEQGLISEANTRMENKIQLDIMNNKLSNHVKPETMSVFNDQAASTTNTRSTREITTTAQTQGTTTLPTTTTSAAITTQQQQNIGVQKTLGKMSLLQLLSSVSKNFKPKTNQKIAEGMSMIPKFVLNGAASQWIPQQYQQKIINAVIKGQQEKAMAAL